MPLDENTLKYNPPKKQAMFMTKAEKKQELLDMLYGVRAFSDPAPYRASATIRFLLEILIELMDQLPETPPENDPAN